MNLEQLWNTSYGVWSFCESDLKYKISENECFESMRTYIYFWHSVKLLKNWKLWLLTSNCEIQLLNIMMEVMTSVATNGSQVVLWHRGKKIVIIWVQIAWNKFCFSDLKLQNRYCHIEPTKKNYVVHSVDLSMKLYQS